MGVGRLYVLGLLVTALWVTSAGADAAENGGEFRFHRDFVLGTSMDLTVLATSRREAEAAEGRVIAEVGRLERILSTWEAGSEISRLDSSTAAVTCSPELLDVLGACEKWRQRSGGAFNAQASQVIDLWKQAEKTGRVPEESALLAVARQIDGRAWDLRVESKVAQRLGRGRVTVDALAKGYIVDKALAAGRGGGGGVTGIILDIGGDIATWQADSQAKQRAGWRITVADPRHPQENAPAMATVRLNGGSIATSGNYARCFQVGGTKYSHIVDPRNGRPADHVASATVVAADCCTADALATILCVLRPEESLDLIRSLAKEGIEAECLIVDREGKQFSSLGWGNLLEKESRPILAMDAGGWSNELLIRLSIVNPGGRRVRRPFVAIWIEDADGKPVRTLSVWGRETKYLKDLSSWWSFARNDRKLVQAVTRASRSPGQYELVWDGKDDAGVDLPQGTYTVRVESAREKGRHVNMKGSINCGEKPETAKIDGNSELGEVTLSYGPREKRP